MSGGVEWEQGQSVTRMVDAIRANDPDAMALAMADYAAALGTRNMSILSNIIAPVMIELKAMREERETTMRTLDTKLDLLILVNERISDATLAREVGGEERQQLMDYARTIPDLTERIQRLEAEYGASREP